MDVLSEGMLNLPDLQALNLSNNRISDAGVKCLMPSLMTSLRQIDLAGNSFGTKGC